MSRPAALVLRTAGTNCDAETARALELAGAQAQVWHLNRLIAAPGRLSEFRIVVIAGGFSFGDDVAAGRVFGLELRRGLGTELRAWVDGGGLALGICNGFQVLVESGLLDPPTPVMGAEEGAREIALYSNASNHYECRWVTLESHDCVCPWVAGGERWPAPVAHAEGRFVVRDEDTLARLWRNRQVALTYVSPEGGTASYPQNPNGSVADIAGICDPSGRVLGLMPHPERNVAPWHHPRWTRGAQRGEGEGLALFRRMVENAAALAVTTG